MRRQRSTTHLQPLLFIILSVAAASSVSLLGGIGIELASENLLPVIPLVVALPSLNTLVGDYATVIAARAADPQESNTRRKQLLRAIGVSVLISIVGIIILSSFIAMRRDYSFTLDTFFRFVGFTAVSIVVVVSFMFVFTTVLDKIFEKKKLNPDDVLIPIVTSVSDVLMLGLIALASTFLF